MENHTGDTDEINRILDNQKQGVKLYWEELKKNLPAIKHSKFLILNLSMNQTASLCRLKINEDAFKTWMKEGLLPALQGIFNKEGDSVSMSNLHEGQMILEIKINEMGKISGYEFLHDLLDSLWKNISVQNIQSVQQIKNYTYGFVNAYWLEHSVNEHLDSYGEIHNNLQNDNKNRFKI